MADSRDIRPFAREMKFLVAPTLAAKIREWARLHLGADPNGSGAFRDEYPTTSVYFDTEQLDVLHRRGSFGRSKYRIRRYGADDLVFLERKLREPAVLAKRRTRTALTSLARLDELAPNRLWDGHWFYARVAARKLRPVCQVSYRRMARLGLASGSVIRLTLDEALTSQDCSCAGFRDGPGVPMGDGRQILELKYSQQPPVLFKHLVEEFGLIPQPASKYRFGMAALGRVPSPIAPRHGRPVAVSGATAAHG
jgi:hypothetical protein